MLRRLAVLRESAGVPAGGASAADAGPAPQDLTVRLQRPERLHPRGGTQPAVNRSGGAPH
jgi:hypothetical protein